jgi:hypothetical protein
MLEASLDLFVDAIYLYVGFTHTEYIAESAAALGASLIRPRLTGAFTGALSTTLAVHTSIDLEH